MIRAVAVVSLLSLLILVLYLPAGHPPEHFLSRLRLEHRAVAAFWGEQPALQMLSRTLAVQDSVREATPVPRTGDTPSTQAVDGAVAQEMASVTRRLFNAPYFRSVDALLLLASFRLSTLLHWLPWLLIFLPAAVLDGYCVRLIKTKEFGQHDPEVFALYACGVVVTLCGTVVAFVAPLVLHPLVLPCLPLVVSLLVGRAVGSFHGRG